MLIPVLLKVSIGRNDQNIHVFNLLQKYAVVLFVLFSTLVTELRKNVGVYGRERNDDNFVYKTVVFCELLSLIDLNLF